MGSNKAVPPLTEPLRHVYTVDVSPSAWTQLAQLEVETYRRIREELDAIAATLTGGGGRDVSPEPEEPEVHRSSVLVDGTVARYDVDHAQRRVLLREVSRR